VFVLQLENQLIDLTGSDGIESCRGFIKQEDAWLKSQRARQPDALLHAAGKIAGHFLEIGFHTHTGEKFLDTISLFGRRHFGMARQWEGDVLLDGEGVVERGMLEQEPHLFSDFIHGLEREAGDLLPVDENRAGAGLLQADDQLEQDAFAGAAATEHGQSFATRDGQIDAIQNDLAAKGLMQAPQDNSWSVSLPAGGFRRRGGGALLCK